MKQHENKISYIEIPSTDIEETKLFFTTVFGWSFRDFGSDYTVFSDQGLNGGFYKSNLSMTTAKGSALIVFYNLDLESSQRRIKDAGGLITRAVFSFPGGSRFHFTEPNGNEYGVWSDK